MKMKLAPKPQFCDLRITNKFLWLPVFAKYNNQRQFRWLERSTIRQRYDYASFDAYKWHTIEFLD